LQVSNWVGLLGCHFFAIPFTNKVFHFLLQPRFTGVIRCRTCSPCVTVDKYYRHRGACTG
jgi:hypothetical protein